MLKKLECQMTTKQNEFGVLFSWEKDIKPHFNYYIPSFLNIFQPSQRQIKIIEKKYNTRHKIESAIIQSSGIFEAKTTIFDLFWQAKENELVPCNIITFVFTINMISWHQITDGGCHVAKISSHFNKGGTKRT